ncbi:hypothetical protein LTR50_001071 [Elasticomyces elasticus]|nr:hypothetical protein LTR50_001071 [Elasticomyces elasticus]
MDNKTPQPHEPTQPAPLAAEDPPAPALSPQDFRTYNRMAEHMDLFHAHFRHTWTTLHSACATNSRPAGTSLGAFLRLAADFAARLALHHAIEERHIFPVLAARMPAFRQELRLLTQHKRIHAGLERFEAYVVECQEGGRELRLGELGELMDGFGEVLWRHLDEEVLMLGAENMRRFWSLEEMRGMPM